MVSSSLREELAVRRVTEARRVVARQRRLFAKLKAYGGRHHSEAGLLADFEKSLAIFENDLAKIRSASDRAPASDALKTRAV